MGLYDKQDEEEQQQPDVPVAPAPEEDAAPAADYQPTYGANADIASLKDATPADPKQMVYDSIRKKYADMFAQGQGDVAAAQKKADRSNMVSGLLDAAGQLFTSRDRARSDAKWDSGWVDKNRQNNATKVATAQQRAQQSLEGALTEDKLGQMEHDRSRQHVAEGRQDAEFGQKQKGWDVTNAENAATSDRSVAARAAYAKMFPEVAGMDGFDNLSAADLKQNMFEPLKLKQTIEAQKAEAAARLAQANQLHQDNLDLRRDMMGQKQEKDQRTDVEKYQKTIDPLMKNMNTMSDIEKALGFDLDTYNPKDNTAEFADPTTGKKVRKEVSLPGSEVPMMGYQPKAAMDDTERAQGRKLDAAVQALYNAKLHENYGARQTDQEVARLEKEFEQGGFATKADYLAGLQKHKQGMKRMHQAVSAGFSPTTVDSYNKGLPAEIAKYLPNTAAQAPADPQTAKVQAALEKAQAILSDETATDDQKQKAKDIIAHYGTK